MIDMQKVQVRPASMADHAAVQALMIEAGWPPRSLAGWRWAFQDNPARNDVLPDAPIGWVVADGTRIGGYLGNIHQRYWQNGRPVLAATCTSLYVIESLRAQSVRLMSAFFRQPEPKLLFTTTANQRSEPLYRLYKSEPLDEGSLKEICLWIADDVAAAGEGLRLAGLASGRLAAVIAPALKAVRRATGWATVPVRPFNGGIVHGGVEQIGPQFDLLWHALRNRPGLIADRSAETLRWHLSDPDLARGHTVFVAHDSTGIAGFAITARHQPKPEQLPRAYLLDCAVRPGAQAAAGALLRAAVAKAASDGLAILEAVRFGGTALGLLAGLGAHCRSVGQQSHFVHAADPALAPSLRAPVDWHLSSLDGDFWFGLSDGGIAAERAGLKPCGNGSGTAAPDASEAHRPRA
jgi:hypothetical protein